MIIVLLTIHLLALSIWVGSLVALVIVARTARAVLDPATQARFFPTLGRTYGKVGTASLVVALLTGAVLAGSPSDWSASVWGAVASAVALLAVTTAAMGQAHRTGLLRRAVAGGDASKVEPLRHAVRVTDAMRGVIALLTLVAVVLEAAAIVHN